MPWTSAPSVPVGRRAHFRRPFPDVLPGLISGDYDGTRILPHTYEALLVVLPASRFYVHARGMTVYAAPGDICIGNVRELHGADAGDARCQARFFLIAPDLLHELSSSRGGTGVMTPCFDGAPILDPPLARALAAMWEEVERPVIASDAADSCRALLRQLIQRYARDSSAPVEDDRVSRAIQRVMEYLQRHVTECVTLQELAEVASVSKGYLAREFHRVIGLPPHAYHVQLRIARAARLLAMGTSLSRVALDAGFADQSHLSRKFKTAYGVTPLAFARAVSCSIDGRRRWKSFAIASHEHQPCHSQPDRRAHASLTARM